MDDYRIKAIPTVYNGVQFRSRLEAKWAAFFDLQRWDWQYEPFDLNGWIPDFLLSPGVLVEIKPINAFDAVVAKEMENAGITSQATALWLLGCTVDGIQIGWGRQTTDPPERWMRMYIHLLPAKDGELILDPEKLHEATGYHVSRAPENCLSVVSKIHLESLRSIYRNRNLDDERLAAAFSDTIKLEWAKAGNIVQWKSPTRKNHHS